MLLTAGGEVSNLLRFFSIPSDWVKKERGEYGRGWSDKGGSSGRGGGRREEWKDKTPLIYCCAVCT